MVFPAAPSSISDIVSEPTVRNGLVGSRDLVLHFAAIADGIPAWGTQIKERDRKLRELWLKEPLLKSAVVATATKYAKLPYALSGDAPRMTNIYNYILQNVDRQRGWVHMWTKLVIDSLTQDNGAIGEIIRLEESPTSPCVSLRQLDTAHCMRTGDPDVPIIYKDRNGQQHDMKYYQVFDLTEAPMPQEEGYGIQICAVSRILEAAQIMRDIRRYKSEKVGGRWNRSIFLTSGVSQATIDDELEKQRNSADSSQLLHYLSPLVIASHQADKPVSMVEIPLASLPDGFDEDTTLRWYIVELALAFLADPQDFAPLMGGHLGTSQQSVILAQKGRSKGPDLFMEKVQHIMNFRGILPRSVKFSYTNQDTASDADKTMIDWRRAQIVALLLGNGKSPAVITPEVAAQMLRDWGLLKDDYLRSMGQEDITPPPVGPDDTYADVDTAKELATSKSIEELKSKVDDLVSSFSPRASLGAPVEGGAPARQAYTVRKTVQYNKDGKITGVVEHHEPVKE